MNKVCTRKDIQVADKLSHIKHETITNTYMAIEKGENTVKKNILQRNPIQKVINYPVVPLKLAVNTIFIT